MKNLKNIIIGLMFYLIILLAILFLINSIRKTLKKDNEVENNIAENIVNIVENNIDGNNVEQNSIDEISEGDFSVSDGYSEVTSPTTYYTVKNYVENFLEKTKSLNNNTSNSVQLLNILDEDYINKNSINSENIAEKISKYGNYTYSINNIYEYAASDTLRTFLVNGNFSENVDGTSSFNIFFALDYASGAYKIYPAGNNNSYINKDEIELNEYNKFENTTVDDFTMCSNYLNLYIQSVKSNPSNSYNLLNKSYRNSRFKDVNAYLEYVNKNKNSILNSKVEKYKVNVKSDGTKEYIIIDNYNKYFIVKADSVMSYSIILDSYTIPLSETIAKYNSATEEEKVCMCLEMVKEMINNKDYSSMYNHLNETFRDNNFSSLSEFSSLIESKYYDINEFSYKSYTVSNNSYIITVSVSDSLNKSNNFDTSFVVKLGSNSRDFQISFSK